MRRVMARGEATAGESDLVTKDDASAGKVVGRDLDRHAVALKHADPKPTHVAAECRQNGMTVGEFDAKGGVGEHFGDLPFQLNWFFFGHSVRLESAGIWVGNRVQGTGCAEMKPGNEKGGPKSAL